MRGKLKAAAMILAAPLAILAAGGAEAGGSLPDPVSSCNDVRAYVGADNSMTMDVFKKLLTAAGYDLAGGGDKVLDTQCKAALYAKTMTMSQHVLTKADGTEIRVTTQLTNDRTVCKLTNISLDGC